jgi:hypothetical protein
MASILEIETEIPCNDIAQFIATLQFDCKIQPFITIKKNNILHGCGIIFNDVSPNELTTTLWKPLQKRYTLESAHLYMPHIYNDIINNLDK